MIGATRYVLERRQRRLAEARGFVGDTRTHRYGLNAAQRCRFGFAAGTIGKYLPFVMHDGRFVSMIH